MSTLPLESLALIELSSIARGYRVLDWMVKESPITVVEANVVEPGKYLLLFGGGVAEVHASFAVAMATVGEHMVDKLLIPLVHPSLWQAIAAGPHAPVSAEVDCIGVVEARTVASGIEAADRAVKDADVVLHGLRITPGLGGKSYYVVQGAQHAVEAAIEVSRSILEPRGLLVDAQVIPRAHGEFVPFVLRKAPFGGG